MRAVLGGQGPWCPRPRRAFDAAPLRCAGVTSHEAVEAVPVFDTVLEGMDEVLTGRAAARPVVEL
ncbi:MAG: hypothetical protein EON53_14670 [Actinomycetales bacterium]|nr:MAG: hypothetical protein EON53_14670 [Actinomycetales bacterium]